MRGHGFVEGLGGSVAGTGDDAHDPRAEGAAPAGEFVGVLKGGDGGVNETRGAETGGEHAGGDDDAHHVGIALAHAAEEFLRELLRVGAGDDESGDGADQHGLGNAHLDGRNAGVAEHEDGNGHERNDGLERGRNEVHLLELGFVDLGVLVTLVVAEDEGDESNADDEDGAAHQGERGVVGDEVHFRHLGHVGDEDVVGRARREVRTDRAAENGSGGGGRLDAGAEHHRNERRTDGGSAAGGRRNGDVDEERDRRADRQQEDAEAADRGGEVVNERTVTLRVGSHEGKAHRAADCHDEGLVRHGLAHGVKTVHRVKTNAAEEETGGQKHQSRFIALDQGPDRNERHGNGDPALNRHKKLQILWLLSVFMGRAAL